MCWGQLKYRGGGAGRRDGDGGETLILQRNKIYNGTKPTTKDTAKEETAHHNGVVGLQLPRLRARSDEQHLGQVPIQLGKVPHVVPMCVLRRVPVQPVLDEAVRVQPAPSANPLARG